MACKRCPNEISLTISRKRSTEEKTQNRNLDLLHRMLEREIIESGGRNTPLVYSVLSLLTKVTRSRVVHTGAPQQRLPMTNECASSGAKKAFLLD